MPTGSLLFAGASYVTIPDNPAFQVSDVTLDGWEQFENASGIDGETLTGKSLSPDAGGNDISDSWAIGYDPYLLNGGCMDYGGSERAAFIWSPQPTDWYHVAVTFVADGGAENLYLDGSGVAEYVQSVTPLYDSSPTLIGADVDFGAVTRFFSGSIAEVRVWSSARSPAQVQSDMTSCVSGNEPNLVAAWHLDEVTGEIAHDITPGPHDGALGPPGSLPIWTANAPP